MFLRNEVSRRFKVVSALSMVGILFIHSKFIMSRWGETFGSSFFSYVSVSVQYLISEQIARICVPLFFIISGYFFYCRYDGTLISYYSQLQKRFKSILIPYLMWSLTWYVFYTIINLKFIDFSDLLNSLINPIPYQFWFLKVLTLCFVASPLLFFSIKNFPKISIIILLSLYFLDIYNFKLEIYGFGFFYLGGYVRYFQINLHKRLINYLIYVYVLSIILGLMLYISEGIEYYYFRVILHKISILSGLFLVNHFIFNGIKRKKYSFQFLLNKQSGFFFFIYAAHEPLLSFLKKIWFQLFSDTYNLIPYILSPIIILYVLNGLYNLLEKKIPLVLKLYTGKR